MSRASRQKSFSAYSIPQGNIPMRPSDTRQRTIIIRNHSLQTAAVPQSLSHDDLDFERAHEQTGADDGSICGEQLQDQEYCRGNGADDKSVHSRDSLSQGHTGADDGSVHDGNSLLITNTTLPDSSESAASIPKLKDASTSNEFSADAENSFAGTLFEGNNMQENGTYSWFRRNINRQRASEVVYALAGYCALPNLKHLLCCRVGSNSGKSSQIASPPEERGSDFASAELPVGETGSQGGTVRIRSAVKYQIPKKADAAKLRWATSQGLELNIHRLESIDCRMNLTYGIRLGGEPMRRVLQLLVVIDKHCNQDLSLLPEDFIKISNLLRRN